VVGAEEEGQAARVTVQEGKGRDLALAAEEWEEVAAPAERGEALARAEADCGSRAERPAAQVEDQGLEADRVAEGLAEEVARVVAREGVVVDLEGEVDLAGAAREAEERPDPAGARDLAEEVAREVVAEVRAEGLVVDSERGVDPEEVGVV
jgi:hypothetical protein